MVALHLFNIFPMGGKHSIKITISEPETKKNYNKILKKKHNIIPF